MSVTGTCIRPVGALAATAAPSFAAGQNGTINANEFVFYYNSYFQGSLSDFANSKSNLAGYTFLTKTAAVGKGQAVKNNSASVENWRGDDARVYYNSGFAGPYDHVYGLTGLQLVITYNENASFQWR